MFLIMLLALTSCVGSLEREKFENKWWEFKSFPLCFNVHESGDLLIYEDKIRSEGRWRFVEPNSYDVQGDMFDAKDAGENCWDIYLHSKAISDIACECTLRDE